MKNMLLFILWTAFICGTVSGQGYKIGDVAEEFSLKNVDGKMVSLADFKNVNGYIIVFTCNHCPYAMMYEKRIIDLHKKYEKQGYPVIAINPNDPEVVPEDDFESMKKMAKKKKYPFVYLFDEGQKVYPKFGATRTPHVFILDKNKKVRYIGAIDDNAKDESAVTVHYLTDAISAIQSGKDPDPATTKAVGCSIKKKG